MKPYILQVTHLGKAIEGQYVAYIDIMDSDKHCFTGIPYKTIVINAINEEFARKIADIRIEEMMFNNESEIDSIYNKYTLIDIANNYRNSYINLNVEMDRLRKKQVNFLASLIKEAQKSEEEGINLEKLVVHVDLYGENDIGHFLYAARTVSNEGSEDSLELKIMTESPYEYEWVSIYDFQKDTAETILSEIMKNLNL